MRFLKRFWKHFKFRFVHSGRRSKHRHSHQDNLDFENLVISCEENGINDDVNTSN